MSHVRVVILLVVACSTRALADATPAKVRKLYDAGITHYNLGEFKEALTDFTEAYRLKHDPVFLFDIAQSYRQIGDAESAAREYRAYLRESPTAPNRADVEKLIEAVDAAAATKRVQPGGVRPPADAVPPAAPPPPAAQPPQPPVSVDAAICSGDCGGRSWTLHEGIGVPRDYAKAFALAQHGCEISEFTSQPCQVLGYYYEMGHGVAQDLPRAVALYRKGCDGREAWGCFHLGWSYFNGVGVNKDPAMGARYIGQGCEMGSVGCGTISWMLHEGTGVPRDYTRAVALAQRGCDIKEFASQPCQVLGVYYELGHGVPRDLARAVALYRQGCEGGEGWGCAHLGWSYLNGAGVTKDAVEARRLLDKACAMAIPMACAQH